MEEINHKHICVSKDEDLKYTALVKEKFAGESPESTGVMENVTAAFVRCDSLSAYNSSLSLSRTHTHTHRECFRRNSKYFRR
jgi:hypothetical protein